MQEENKVELDTDDVKEEDVSIEEKPKEEKPEKVEVDLGYSEPIKQETPYKSAVSNIPSIKQVQNNYLNNKSVYLPDIYKQTSTTKLNNVNQLLILKEVKWGEI